MIELTPVTMVGVFGPVASGKTFQIKQWLAQMTHALVIDVNWEYDDGSVNQVIEGSPRQLLEAVQDAPEGQENARGDAVDERKPSEGHKVAYVPNNLQQGFGWAVEAYWQLDMPRWLVIEEIHEFMSPWQKHPHMDKIMRYSRKRQLGVIGSSQRIASVHKDFCSNCRMSLLFHTTEPVDIKGIQERYGDEVARAVRNLRPLLYNDSTGVVKQTPEVFVHSRGLGIQIVDLGTGKSRKIKSDQGELPLDGGQELDNSTDAGPNTPVQ